MTQNLFNGLPPRVVTYIKIHLRYIFSTGLFSYQEREDYCTDRKWKCTVCRKTAKGRACRNNKRPRGLCR